MIDSTQTPKKHSRPLSARPRLRASLSATLLLAGCGIFQEIGWDITTEGESHTGTSMSPTSATSSETSAGTMTAATDSSAGSESGGATSTGNTTGVDSGTESSTRGGTTTSDDSETGADSTSTGAATDGTSTGDESTSSTGGELPPGLSCEDNGVVIDSVCGGGGGGDLFFEVEPALVVDPLTTEEVELPLSACGDINQAAGGMVLRVRLTDPCLWSMQLSLICPAGAELELNTVAMCGQCSQAEGSYELLFRATGAANACVTCNIVPPKCVLEPTDQDSICTFLGMCAGGGDEPWLLRVEAGDSKVEIESVALHMEFNK